MDLYEKRFFLIAALKDFFKSFHFQVRYFWTMAKWILGIGPPVSNILVREQVIQPSPLDSLFLPDLFEKEICPQVTGLYCQDLFS